MFSHNLYLILHYRLKPDKTVLILLLQSKSICTYMNKNILISNLVLLFIIVSNFLTAQEAITTSGGDASGSGGSVSYSVGQILYSTNTGANGSVAHGVQQPFEISVVIGIEEASSIN